MAKLGPAADSGAFFVGRPIVYPMLAAGPGGWTVVRRKLAPAAHARGFFVLGRPVLTSQLRQLGDVGGDAPGLVAGGGESVTRQQRSSRGPAL